MKQCFLDVFISDVGKCRETIKPNKMCFELPSKVIAIDGQEAKIEGAGHKHKVSLELVKNVKVGDYVLVQADFAISKMEEAQVKELMDLLKDTNIKNSNKNQL